METYIECPNCEGMIEILQINCGIFRHGVIKENMEQINPHAPEEYCNKIYSEKLIYGCGKPFQLILLNDEYKAIKCEYV